MNPIDAIKELLKTFGKKRNYKDRSMKRVFQWKRYLEWDSLTHQERLSAKRLLLMPLAAYLVFTFINQYAFALIFIIFLYLAYKKFEKGKLTK
ncbi:MULTISPECIES: hypothetical protein [unclassified Prochlorococcus]|uniref:hypothetical protein n=1 Tax=unclassified Prochlorococcus TaxID=2627481 RepID=UPI000533B951|nr:MULTISPECIES: hypothetical protein [unclassified Prochlorococcus]KGG14929.1 hypothetical protein EV06_1995 [Prochlorococcus sp. MIT 0602]KGG15638.1 hypothetical protein EV07_1603 [Prochlorococcus sp. MIT 0603]